MSLRVSAALAVGISLIVLPVIIVRAQSEGETQEPPPTDAIEEPAADATAAEEAQQEPEVTAPAEQGGSVLGASTGETDASATTSDPASSGDESSEPTLDFLILDTASSTASSTEPVADAPAEEPKEEPFVLQPAVSLHVDGASISADIELENLTCKACEKVLPAAQVKAYYTAWYPNDGPDLKEVGDRLAAQDVEVSDVALWSSRSMSWSASDIAPGRYYFVVVVDPENAIGAYRMQRMEFVI